LDNNVQDSDLERLRRAMQNLEQAVSWARFETGISQI